MINIWIASLYTIFSLFLFIGATRVNELNRLIMNIPVTLFTNSVSIADYRDKTSFYFRKEKLERDVNSYFEQSTSNRSIDYSVEFTYFKNDGLTYCVDDKCQGVKVTLSSNYFLSYEYERSMTYVIGEAR